LALFTNEIVNAHKRGSDLQKGGRSNMNIGLWVVQELLALIFIGVGGIKVFA